MTASPRRTQSSRARQRVQRRIAHPELWSDSELQRLDRLYRLEPKRWWHVHRVVRQQVLVGHRALELGVGHLLTASLLNELALDADPDALAKALRVALSLAHRSPDQRPWTSLEVVLSTLLRLEEAVGQVSLDVASPDFGDAFTPLANRKDLRTEGRRMRSCIGELRWWRHTMAGRGVGYAVRHGDSRATVWVAPRTRGGPLGVIDAFGPQNRPLDASFGDWISAQISGFGSDAKGAQPSLDGLPGCDHAISEWELMDSIELLADRLSERQMGIAPSPSVPRPRVPRSLPGLPPVHWVRHHSVFADPPRVRPPLRGRHGAHRPAQAAPRKDLGPGRRGLVSADFLGHACF